jgi:hypothetical protein
LIVLALAVLVAWVVGASILFCAYRDVEKHHAKQRPSRK